jgi:ribonuclease VapC
VFVDASALVAILLREPEGKSLADRIEVAPRRLTSALAVYEATLAIARAREMSIDRASRHLTTFLDRAGIETVQIGEAERDAALKAFDHFGKGRHPARLNMVDCFAYACARTNGVPLLFKGDDFAQTDVWIA